MKRFLIPPSEAQTLVKRAKQEQGSPDLLFWRENESNGYLSNFYGKKQLPSFRLVIGGKEWPSTEHYYQAQKFHSDTCQPPTPAYADLIEAIRTVRTPYQAKLLSRLQPTTTVEWRMSLNPIIRQALDQGVSIRSDWERVKEKVMRATLMEKFIQNPTLQEQLLATAPRRLVENSPYDEYWGIGRSREGKNRLGELLMEVREELLARQPIK